MMKKLWVWLLFLVGVNVVWLLIDKTPPAWDQAAHIRSVVLASRGDDFVEMIRSFGGYPPLIYMLGGLWVNIFGTGVMTITLLNSIFLVVVVIGVYYLGGLLPAVLFSLFPVVYDISRSFLLDLPLMAWVVWGLFFWLRRKDNWLWLMLILASLTKLNGFLYFVPIFIFLLLENRKSINFWLRMVIGGLVYLVSVGWWWGINWQNIYQYLTGLAGTGEALTDPMNLTSWVTWRHYFRLFFLHQVGPIVAMVAIVSWSGIEKSEKNKKLIFWAIAVYVIFTIIRNKDFRFTMPLLPVVAVWLGDWLSKIKYKWVAYIFIVYLFFNYVENSFGWPIKKPVLVVTPTFLLGDIEWVGFDDYPVRAASGIEWPNEKIVRDIEKMAIDNNSKRQRVLILINKEEVNDNNLGMYREIYGSNVFDAGSVGAREKFIDDNEIEVFMKDFGGVLVAQQDFEPAPFYGVNLQAYKQARDWVWDNQDKFNIEDEYLIYGNIKLYLMRKLP